MKARRAEAARLRMQGLDYRSIAERMGMSLAGVYKMVTKAGEELDQIAAESLAMQRRLELDRLDIATRVVMAHVAQLAAAKKPNPHAVDQLVRISERRSKLLGLDAATQLIVQQQLDAKLAEGLMHGLDAIKDILRISDEDYLRALEHIAARQGGGSPADEGEAETEDEEPVH